MYFIDDASLSVPAMFIKDSATGGHVFAWNPQLIRALPPGEATGLLNALAARLDEGDRASLRAVS